MISMKKIHAAILIFAAIAIIQLKGCLGFSTQSFSISRNQKLYTNNRVPSAILSKKDLRVSAIQMNVAVDQTTEVQIGKTEAKLGLSFDMIGEDVIVYSIEDSALPEVKDQLQKGDIIVSINGIKYTTDVDVANGIRNISVGETLKIAVNRTEEIPEESGLKSIQIRKTNNRLGLRLKMVEDGIQIDKIPESAVAGVKEKLKEGDQILSFNNKSYSTDSELAAAIRGIDQGQLLSFSIMRPVEQAEETEVEAEIKDKKEIRIQEETTELEGLTVLLPVQEQTSVETSAEQEIKVPLAEPVAAVEEPVATVEEEVLPVAQNVVLPEGVKVPVKEPVAAVKVEVLPVAGNVVLPEEVKVPVEEPNAAGKEEVLPVAGNVVLPEEIKLPSVEPVTLNVVLPEEVKLPAMEPVAAAEVSPAVLNVVLPVKEEATVVPAVLTVKLPPANAKLPPANAKLPPANVKLPPADVKLPPADVKLPSANVKLPPANVKLPPANVKLPPASVKLPPAKEASVTPAALNVVLPPAQEEVKEEKVLALNVVLPGTEKVTLLRPAVKR